MTTLDFFTEWTEFSAKVIDTVIESFPCFVEIIPVEMGWAEINIKARTEDLPAIQILVSGIV